MLKPGKVVAAWLWAKSLNWTAGIGSCCKAISSRLTKPDSTAASRAADTRPPHLNATDRRGTPRVSDYPNFLKLRENPFVPKHGYSREKWDPESLSYLDLPLSWE